MKQPNWKSVVELFGIGAIVASLVFVGLELRQSQNIAVAQLFQENTNVRLAVDDLLIQNADLIAKSNRKDELTPDEDIALRAVLDSVYSQSFFGTASWRTISDNDAFSRGPAVVFFRLLKENPGLRRAWSTYRLGIERDWELFGMNVSIVKAYNDNIEQQLSKSERKSD